ncbi:MAG: riboflavin synthase [Gammaproteobacteria bacterium]
MFTGIIQSVGNIAAIKSSKMDSRLKVNVGTMSFNDVEMGESISINGACMTVVAFDKKSFSVDVSRESLALTTLGGLKAGSAVNLERAMQLSDRLGGHLVSGHIDGLGEITQRAKEGKSTRFSIRVPKDLAKYIAHKGSVCVDGVSLTVNKVNGNEFSLQIIPHTLQETIFSEYIVGSKVNIEVDLIARYLERLIMKDESNDEDVSGVTAELLSRTGFLL